MDYKIIDELKTLMEKSPATHAMWIAGSVAEGYADELSDIDLWLDIDDGQDEAVFNAIEEFLELKGKLDINYGEDMSPPFTHKVYHFKDTNPYHFIEFTLHSHSDTYEFTEGMRKVKVLFDKDGTTKTKPFDKVGYDKMLQERKKTLTRKIEIGEISVRKEIIRKHFMDALHNYQFWLVEPIIELTRIRYAPLKISYGLKHGSRDLPPETVKEIESLYLIKSLKDLENKIDDIKTMVKKYG